MIVLNVDAKLLVKSEVLEGYEWSMMRKTYKAKVQMTEGKDVRNTKSRG